MATSGDILLAIREDFYMAMDTTRRAPSRKASANAGRAVPQAFDDSLTGPS